MKRAWSLIGRIAYFLAWPALYVYLRGCERTRVLVSAEGKILLVKGWLSNGNWGLPGGGTHRGENVVAAAVREVAEETGVGLNARELRSLASEKFSRRGLSFQCHYFAAALTAAAETRPQHFEITEVRWVAVTELGGLRIGSEVYHALELADRTD